MSKAVKDWRRTAGYAKMRKALERNAERWDELPEVRENTINDFMNFWVQRQMLVEDIKEHGVSVVDERGNVRENRSISLSLQVSKHMMMLYEAMGIPTKMRGGKAAGVEVTRADEDDEL